MTRCSPRCCSGCRDDLRDRKKAKKEELRYINACKEVPLPDLVDDDSDDDSDDSDDDSDPPTPDEALEEGDHIFATGLFPEPQHINATSTVSQRLAEAFKKNSEALENAPLIQDYLREF